MILPFPAVGMSLLSSQTNVFSERLLILNGARARLQNAEVIYVVNFIWLKGALCLEGFENVLANVN